MGEFDKNFKAIRELISHPDNKYLKEALVKLDHLERQVNIEYEQLEIKLKNCRERLSRKAKKRKK